MLLVPSNSLFGTPFKVDLLALELSTIGWGGVVRVKGEVNGGVMAMNCKLVWQPS